MVICVSNLTRARLQRREERKAFDDARVIRGYRNAHAVALERDVVRMRKDCEGSGHGCS
jgi:hypothetical protein